MNVYPSQLENWKALGKYMSRHDQNETDDEKGHFNHQTALSNWSTTQY